MVKPGWGQPFDDGFREPLEEWYKEWEEMTGVYGWDSDLMNHWE